ncbi:hypothetical protein CPB86DRAFT_727301 [Serendipita vermifera]|nr:hypothetical protein CPB86DRAFT_727301 [Serendipita vermifera]
MSKKDQKIANESVKRPSLCKWLLFTTFVAGLVGFLGTTLRIYISPFLLSYSLSYLSLRGIKLDTSQPEPQLQLSVLPPTVSLHNVHLNIRNHSADFPYPVDISIDKIAYSALYSPYVFTSLASTPEAPEGATETNLVRFLSVEWSNVTMILHEPHPRPRMEVLDGRITLLSKPLGVWVKKWTAALLKSEIYDINHSPLAVINTEKVTFTTHTVTSVPIPITNPTISDLVHRFPSFFSLFAKPSAQDNAEDLSHVLMYPPHLGLFAPSLVLPAIHQALSTFRHRPIHDNGNGHAFRIYRFPIPALGFIFEVEITRGSTRKMRTVQVKLIPDTVGADEVSQTTCLHPLLASVAEFEVAGREKGGKGGCCTFVTRDIGNCNGMVLPISNSPVSILTKVKRWLRTNELVSIFLHPFYLSSYIHSLLSTMRDPPQDLCSAKDLLHYQIGEVTWRDETPNSSSSTVSKAFGHVHRGFVNIFENAIGLMQ